MEAAAAPANAVIRDAIATAAMAYFSESVTRVAARAGGWACQMIDLLGDAYRWAGATIP